MAGHMKMHYEPPYRYSGSYPYVMGALGAVLILTGGLFAVQGVLVAREDAKTALMTGGLSAVMWFVAIMRLRWLKWRKVRITPLPEGLMVTGAPYGEGILPWHELPAPEVFSHDLIRLRDRTGRVVLEARSPMMGFFELREELLERYRNRAA